MQVENYFQIEFYLVMLTHRANLKYIYGFIALAYCRGTGKMWCLKNVNTMVKAHMQTHTKHKRWFKV